MKKLLIIAALMMLATSAFAAVQNVKVSGDITTYGVGQYIYDLDDDAGDADVSSYTAGDENNFFATITRLRVDADLTDNVAATIRLSNEREWGEVGQENTDVNLDLAYITLKEIFYSPLTVMIGRQDLAYGSTLVVGDPNTNANVAGDSDLDNAPYLSKAKSFDAIVGVLDYDPWTIDLLYAKISEIYEGSNDEDQDILGLNLAYDFADYEAETEAYVFFVDGDQATASEDITVLGLRGSLAPADGLTIGAEIAIQTGDYSTTQDMDALAATIEGSYVWDNEYSPMIKLCYDYRSGDNDTSAGDFDAWDPLYEDQTKGLIADYLFEGVNGGVNSNAQIINLGGSFQPTEDLTIALDWFNYTLDEKLSSAPSTWNSGMASQSIKSTEDDLGNEIDLAIVYDYTEDVVIGLQAGWFMPGDVFEAANDDDAFALVGSIAVSF
ncbi:MAG: alginate export family protein [Candidatus Kaelpia aquatica]|nr:alginate export family protein [Candidatus Kaelpia aquatica]